MLHFVCIGAQKSGTTWLYENLSLHPGVSFPGGKEVHFWSRHLDWGLSFYESLFAVPDGRLHGDITPAYAILPAGVIAECRRAFPDLRLIYILRNPIDRAISHAKMDASIAGLQPMCLPDQWFKDHFRSAASLARGDYETCLKNWLSVYPEESLLLRYFDDLETEPAALLGECSRHLNLEDIYQCDSPLLAERICPGPPAIIHPELLAVLHEIYDEKILSLGRFLGRDLSPWARGRRCPTSVGAAGRPGCY